MFGNPLAGLGQGDQFGLAGGVLLLGRHLPGQLGIAVGKPDDGFMTIWQAVEVELRGVRLPHLEGHLALFDVLEDAGQALVEDLGVVQVAAAPGQLKKSPMRPDW